MKGTLIGALRVSYPFSSHAISVKLCSKCKSEKPESEFRKDKSRKSGLTPQCKDCMGATKRAWNASLQGKLKSRQYRQTNKDRIRDQKRAWESEHREELNERSRKYREEHPDERKATQAKYRANNKDKIDAYNAWYREQHREACNERIAEWKANNPLKIREYANRRNARKRETEVEPVSYEAILERDGAWCYLCDTEIDVMLVYPDQLSLSFDHIIALAVGGTHTEENITPTHLGCNVKKGATMVSQANAA